MTPGLELLVEFVEAWNNKVFFLEGAAAYEEELGKTMQGTFGVQRPRANVSISSLGYPMAFQVLNKLGLKDPLEAVPANVFALWFGNAVECLVMSLMDDYGVPYHSYQKDVDFHGIPGSLDFMVDGCVVDVKSMSPYYFDSWHGKNADEANPNDDRGYITQILAYRQAVGATGAAILAINKQTGRMALTPISVLDEEEYERNNQYTTGGAILKRATKVAEMIQADVTLESVLDYPVETMQHRVDKSRTLLIPSIRYDSRAALFFKTAAGTNSVKTVYDAETVWENVNSFADNVHSRKAS